ncbi:ATP-binding protein [Nocardiopsis sp. CT-R113]|uniref:ATP-binding protein n=1 Tax=Nocardiopsis codii TaxID=3065942 RepID=A0ABU7K9M3_9ACTN|nr:ATP-binding protein [Nocardiopsis sp. CT-R113]MEE2038948.1 ATP-binding protein [Nocardiopsis sp. CT-R113]
MQSIDTTAPSQDPDPAGVPYPHRIAFTEPHKHGIVLGHTRDYTGLMNWVWSVAPRGAAKGVEQIAEALVSNAHRHTRSGDPGGTVRVVVDINPFLIGVAVTDGGPRRETVIPYPRLGDPRQAPLPGLHLVDQLALYWEWHWEWKATAMGPLTIRAVVENP